MKDRSIEELMQIIGERRGDYSAAEIDAAEAELRRRTSGEEVEFKRKMKRSGTVAAFFGGVMMLFALMAIVPTVAMFSEGPPVDEEATFLERNFFIIFFGAIALQAVVGATLLVGGLAMRGFREWGRKLVVLVLGASILYVVGSFAFWEGSVISMAGFGVEGIAMAISGALIFAVFFVLLWMPWKYFRSQRVKDYCV